MITDRFMEAATPALSKALPAARAAPASSIRSALLLTMMAPALLLGTAAFGASPPASPAPAPAPGATAVHVVHLMQLDTGAMLGVKASVREGAKRGKVAADELQCMEKLSPAELTDVLAGVVSSALSPAEIADTDAFYSTPVGRKSVQIGVDQLRQKFGDTTVGAIPPFTAEDEAATRKFSATPAGRKIFVDKVLQTGPAMDLLRGRIVSLMVTCKQKGQRVGP